MTKCVLVCDTANDFVVRQQQRCCKNYSMEKKNITFVCCLSLSPLPTSDNVLSVVERPLAMFSLSRVLTFALSTPKARCLCVLWLYILRDSCDILCFLWSWYHFSSTLWNFSLSIIYTTFFVLLTQYFCGCCCCWWCDIIFSLFSLLFRSERQKAQNVRE